MDVFDGAQNQVAMKEIQQYELMGGEECIKKILDQGRELTNYTPNFVECWSEIKSFSSLPRGLQIQGKRGIVTNDVPEKQTQVSPLLDVHTNVCVCIYIYTYNHYYMYI